MISVAVAKQVRNCFNRQMQQVQVRLFAAARAAAKADEIQAAPGSIAEILAFCATGNPDLQQIFPQCTVLVDGIASHDHGVFVTSGSQMDVLPKFAGG
jgi:molybdopterin synthase sulfur carrier subunit